MVVVEKLTIEEKVKILRKIRKVDQKELAEIIGRETNTIYRAEKGERLYTEEELVLIKGHFGIPEAAPLTDMELAIYKERLYVWRERIREELLDEARKLRTKLDAITELPFEQNLTMLYKAIGVRLLLKDDDIEEAGKHIEFLEANLEGATKEIQYHFLYAKGLYGLYTRNFKDALNSFSKALNLEINELEFEKEDALHYNIAFCHSKLGMYFVATTSYLKIYNKFNHDRVNTTGMLVENALALDFMRLGHVDKAEELFNKVLMKARILESKTHIGHALQNLGCVYFSSKKRDYKKAILHINQALVYRKKGSALHLECLYYKIRCLIALKNPEYIQILAEAKLLSESNMYYSILFTSLSHLASLKEDESKEYIENTTIPFLLDNHEYFKILDYCEILEKCYDGNFTKIAKFKAINDDVYKRMHREEIEY